MLYLFSMMHKAIVRGAGGEINEFIFLLGIGIVKHYLKRAVD